MNFSELVISNMKNQKLFNLVIFLSFTLTSCNTNRIKVSERGLDIPEPDKALRIDCEVKDLLKLVAKEITNSNNIESCESGNKMIKSGVEIIPYLKTNFMDTTDTKVFSERNNRTLKIGEIAIIIANFIKPIPIAKVIGIQQCIPPFETNVESFLWKIEKEPNNFMTQYESWIKEF